MRPAWPGNAVMGTTSNGGGAQNPGRIRQQNEDSVLMDRDKMFAVADEMAAPRPARSPAPSRCNCSSADSIPPARSTTYSPPSSRRTTRSSRRRRRTSITRAWGRHHRPLHHPALPASGEATDGRGRRRRRRRPTTEVRHGSFALVKDGDSRTYLMRHGRLQRITVDHNYVQELVSSGRHHRRRGTPNTHGATSSPGHSASIPPCVSTLGRCRSCAATASSSAGTVCPTRSTTARSTRS